MNSHLPRCPVCWTHHVPDCQALDAIADSEASSVTYVFGASETGGDIVRADWADLRAWVRQELANDADCDALERMWALPAKEA